MAKRVVVAMSGGVDSSMAAALLQEAGYEVIGVTMRLWTVANPELPAYQRRCCSVEAVDDARRVCQILGLPFYFVNLEREFQTYVVDYFCQEYARGRTPNPCLACNQHLKFRFLRQQALSWGADYLATGHYARISQGNGPFHLLKSVDAGKDQSYALYMLGQEALARLLLPVGHYTKEEIRRRAAALNLPVAQKPDSQQICFIPGNSYVSFLKERITSRPGPVVDKVGRVLGEHQGIAFYTIGQRHGLGIAGGRPLYVIERDAATNRLVLGPNEALFKGGLLASQVHFVSGQAPPSPLDITAKIRYRGQKVAARFYLDQETARVVFAAPQRGIAPGQAVVFYQGEEVLGGGIIEKSLEAP